MNRPRDRALTDHDDIRQWAKDHDAVPASVRGTTDDARVGVLTFDVQGHVAEEVELAPVEWDEWLQAFEDNWLALIVRDPTAADSDPASFRLINRDTVRRD